MVGDFCEAIQKMNITATRRLQFCAGHRVFGHESKCGHLHGHNYVAFFEASPDIDVDAIGRVIDFSVLKQRIGEWIDRNWDHGMILNMNDREAIQAVSTLCCPGGSQKLYLMPCNPTAENMANHLVRDICPTLFNGSGVRIMKVTIWETENCFAVAEREV